MVETIQTVVQTINAYLSDYILVFLLIAVGLWYTIKTGFVQVRYLGAGLKKIFGELSFKGGDHGGGMSSFQFSCDQVLKGYEDGGRLYGAGSFVGVKQKGITIPSGIEQDSSGMPGEYYGKEFIPFNTNEQGDFEVYLYGAEDFAVNEMQVWEGVSIR